MITTKDTKNTKKPQGRAFAIEEGADFIKKLLSGCFFRVFRVFRGSFLGS